MVFAGAIGSCVRRSSLRIPIQRLSSPAVQNQLLNARSFSLLLQHPTCFGSSRIRLFAVTSRGITQQASGTPAAITDTPSIDISQPATQLGIVPQDPPAEIVPDLTDAAATYLPAALQYGDMAALGLASWTPAGLVRWSLEIINVTTGLPWFWTLVAGSIFWKAVLVPLSVKGLQNSARLLPLQPMILQNQKEMETIRRNGDKLALQRHALKMRKMYKDAGVSMGATALIPVIQIPVTLGMFFGVKKLCDLPLLQLTHSGLDILPDLTAPDPYMILPVLLCAAVNLQINVGAAELNLHDRPEMGHIMNGLRLLSVAGIWFMSGLPSGLLVSLVTTSFATTIQSFALQRPAIRKALNIPEVPARLRGKLPSPMSSVRYVIDKWRSKVAEANAIAKQQKKRR